MATDHPDDISLLTMTARIVRGYVGGNAVRTEDIAALIETVARTLSDLAAASARRGVDPASAIRQSITPDYLICLEDGRKLTLLKRHLRMRYGMSPAQYRQKWGLPRSYPMVAPNYAARRAKATKASGLGTHSRRDAAER